MIVPTFNTDDQSWQPEDLGKKIRQGTLPGDLQEKLENHLNRLTKVIASSGYKIEFDRELEYLEFTSGLPFNKASQDILDLSRAREVLNSRHFGLETVKERILEYLAVLILNSRQGLKMHVPVLTFLGLVGSGKTSLAYSIAECLGRKIIRIPFGGLGSVRELRGESRVQVEAEPGKIMKAIYDVGVNNPVILLDEIDRVAAESRADVMGVLVELLDPEQNFAFSDHYIDYPFDLSGVLFIATANNLNNIATAVLDRLEVIEMPAYSDEEKVVIGRDFILPQALKDAGLSGEVVKIDENLWPKIVRPLGFDAGIRSLKREIEGIARKVAKHVVMDGSKREYILTEKNIGQYVE